MLTLDQVVNLGADGMWNELASNKRLRQADGLRSEFLLDPYSPQFALECSNDWSPDWLLLTGHLENAQGERQPFSTKLIGADNVRNALKALASLKDDLPWSWSIALLTCPLTWRMFSRDEELALDWINNQLRRFEVSGYIHKTLKDCDPDNYNNLIDSLSSVLGVYRYLYTESKQVLLDCLVNPQLRLSESELSVMLMSNSLVNAAQVTQRDQLTSATIKMLKALPYTIYPSRYSTDRESPRNRLDIEANIDFRKPTFSTLRHAKSCLQETFQEMEDWIRRVEANPSSASINKKIFVITEIRKGWEQCQMQFWLDAGPNQDKQLDCAPLIYQMARIARHTTDEYGLFLLQEEGWVQRALDFIFSLLRRTSRQTIEQRSVLMLKGLQLNLLRPTAGPASKEVLADIQRAMAPVSLTEILPSQPAETIEACEAYWQATVASWFTVLDGLFSPRGDTAERREKLKDIRHKAFLYFHPDKFRHNVLSDDLAAERYAAIIEDLNILSDETLLLLESSEGAMSEDNLLRLITKPAVIELAHRYGVQDQLKYFGKPLYSLTTACVPLALFVNHAAPSTPQYRKRDIEEPEDPMRARLITMEST